MNIWNSLPIVTKNIILLCALMLLVTSVFPLLEPHLACYYYQSGDFRPWQLVTYMFMHANVFNLFFNMMGLLFFGGQVEYYWGARKFLNYFLVCGLGAVVLHQCWTAVEIHQLAQYVQPENFAKLLEQGKEMRIASNHPDLPMLQRIFEVLNTPMVGASGGLFGIMIAFAVMFPNAEIYLLFFPFPVKAKYLITIFAVVEVFAGLSNSASDNVAHFAHLGGLLTGLIIVLVWRKRGKLFL